MISSQEIKKKTAILYKKKEMLFCAYSKKA